MVDDVMFASDKQDWETPDWLFNRLNLEFSFDLDVCATKENAKIQNYLDENQDSLASMWFGTCWMNPPYGREIGKWTFRAMQQAMKGNAEVVCLLPARTDTGWWWNTARHGEVRFLKGRLKFKGAENSAPFPSAIVVFRRYMELGQGTTKYWEIKDDSSNG